jgi:hypothetical protein
MKLDKSFYETSFSKRKRLNREGAKLAKGFCSNRSTSQRSIGWCCDSNKGLMPCGQRNH